MGYYSDVNIAFYVRGPYRVSTTPVPRPAEEHMPVLKLWFDENYPHQTAIEHWRATITVEMDYILVKYTGVKWYEDFEHVEAVNAALEKFKDNFDLNTSEETYLAYEMMRVGEEINDIESEGSMWHDFRFHVLRDIVFD